MQNGRGMPFMSGFTMLPPFLLCLSACFLMPAAGEVGANFDNCLKFFLDGTPPSDALIPHNPAWICQEYKNAYRFATMYDRKNRIPIYSAYKFGSGKGPRSDDWYVEPQLAKPGLGSSMEDERSSQIIAIFKEIQASQAVSADYAGALFIDKGHLNPHGHQPDADSRTATFTLTNIVPQYNKLNQGTWSDYEDSVMKRSRGCRDTYIITGVVPGNNFISGDRVNRPSHIWSAACCVIDNNHRRSWAVLAPNDQDNTTLHSLRKLEEDLANLYNKQIDLFHGSCY